jgi:hypothetical protein
MDTTNQLFKDLSTTESHTSEIEKDVSQLDQDVTSLANDLLYSKKVNSSLHTIDSDLGVAISLLEIVSIIPEIGAEAGALKDTLATFRAPIQSAASVSDKVEKVIAPIRQKLQQAEPILEKADHALLGLMNDENALLHAIGGAQRCIESLPSGNVRSGLEKNLDAVSGELDPLVKKFDGGQVELLQMINAGKNEVEQLQTWAKNLVSIENEIDAVEKKLAPLLSALQSVANALKQTVRVPYGGYPKICHHKVLGVSVPYPCGWHTVYFSFSIKQVLNGLSGVVKPVEDALMAAANAVLRPLLRALHLQITLPSIPGLSALGDMAAHFETYAEVVFHTFDKIENEVASIASFAQSVEKFVNQVESIAKNCSIHATGKNG